MKIIDKIKAVSHSDFRVFSVTAKDCLRQLEFSEDSENSETTECEIFISIADYLVSDTSGNGISKEEFVSFVGSHLRNCSSSSIETILHHLFQLLSSCKISYVVLSLCTFLIQFHMKKTSTKRSIDMFLRCSPLTENIVPMCGVLSDLMLETPAVYDNFAKTILKKPNESLASSICELIPHIICLGQKGTFFSVLENLLHCIDSFSFLNAQTLSECAASIIANVGTRYSKYLLKALKRLEFSPFFVRICLNSCRLTCIEASVLELFAQKYVKISLNLEKLSELSFIDSLTLTSEANPNEIVTKYLAGISSEHLDIPFFAQKGLFKIALLNNSQENSISPFFSQAIDLLFENYEYVRSEILAKLCDFVLLENGNACFWDCLFMIVEKYDFCYRIFEDKVPTL